MPEVRRSSRKPPSKDRSRVISYSVGRIYFALISLGQWLVIASIWAVAFFFTLWLWERVSYAAIGHSICQNGPILSDTYVCLSDSQVSCYLDPQEARNSEIYHKIHQHNVIMAACMDAKKINL